MRIRYHFPMPPNRSVHDDAVRFGSIVNGLRRRRGWTLEDLARFSGMNATYLGVLERGGNMPGLATILRLAEVFGVRAVDLVGAIEQAREEARAERERQRLLLAQSRPAGDRSGDKPGGKDEKPRSAKPNRRDRTVKARRNVGAKQRNGKRKRHR